MKKRKIILSLLLLAGFAHGEEPPTAIPVSVKPVGEILIHPQQSAPATVISLNDARISARIDAEIQSFKVKVGDSIQQGQVLVELDCADSRLLLDNSQAALSLAELELNRARSLSKSNVLSAQQLNQRSTEHAQARIAYQQAQLQVERCQIKAPFEGIITARHASEGELAAPGTALLQLLDTSRIELTAQIAAIDAKSYENAAAVHFSTQGKTYPLTRRTLLPLQNTAARTREARLLFDGENALPGSAGRLIWTAPQAFLPADYLVQRGDQIGIFLLKENRAEFFPLPDAIIGHPVPAPFNDNRTVIIDGRQSLQDGDNVRVAE
jgi:RND family efflux transporter MFP subunit